MPEKVIIDTDPGIDDAMAILFALTHPEIELLGLTAIFGNVTVDIGTRNALRLSELAGKPVPVAKGAAVPLEQTPRPIASFVHGEEGFGSVPAAEPSGTRDLRPAAQFLVDAVNEAPGDVVLCPVGPLTNLADALALDPSIADKVKAVHIMGGSIDAGGNASPHAEANIWQDPHAADRVMAASWPIRMIGLDVTQKVKTTEKEFADLASKAPVLGGFLNEAVQFYFGFHEKHEGFYGAYMHDALAVISIIRPEFFGYEDARFEITSDGEKAGATMASDTPEHNHQWAREVKAEEAKEFFFSHMAATG
ncbi:MAG: nucleoside hydrolase [Pseudomonadota bacterium]